MKCRETIKFVNASPVSVEWTNGMDGSNWIDHCLDMIRSKRGIKIVDPHGVAKRK